MRVFCFILLLGQSLSQGAITRGPYLQLSHSTGMTVVWRADQKLSDPKVRCWKGDEEIEAKCVSSLKVRTISSSFPLSAIPADQRQYEVELSELEPDSSYRYALFDGEEQLTSESALLNFTTSPVTGNEKPTRIWVVGDSGTGEAHQRMVHEAMLRYSKNREMDLYLHVGDMAYGQGTDVQFQEKFFEPYQVTLQNTVCWGALGNHEGKSSKGSSGVGPFFDAFVNPMEAECGGVPSGSESYYSFDYGSIHFICLNSYDLDRSSDGKMARWLEKDLQETKAQWILGFWHHPPYTKGSHNSDVEIELIEMRENIMPILEAGGVDLVLSGHSHIYERSMLIDGAYQTPTTAKGVILDDGDGNPSGDGPYKKPEVITPHRGTVAVVTGHGGALARNSRGIMPIMRSLILDHGSTIIDIDGETLSATMIDLVGQERDHFQIVKKGAPLRRVVESPWTPDSETLERTGAGVIGSTRNQKEARQARLAGQKVVLEQVPESVRYLIPKNADWFYLAGGEKPETEMWTKRGFDSVEEGWKKGKAGFGYGDGDDRTLLEGMQNRYDGVFIRREFEISNQVQLDRIGLAINYDDGFILHLNGKQLFSRSIGQRPNGKLIVSKHEAKGTEYFCLSAFKDQFVLGKNIIGIEGYNADLVSSDFSLDPYLVEEIPPQP